jgi:hypothetical protein
MRLSDRRARVALIVALTFATSTPSIGQSPAANPAKCDSLYRPPMQPKNGPAYNACAVDVRPSPLVTTFAANIPHWSGEYDASWIFIVDRDGKVDPAWTSLLDGSSSLLSENGPIQLQLFVVFAARGVKFNPGVFHGSPVRTAIHLVLEMPPAPDSLPATATWKYIAAPVADTMRLEWHAGAPLALDYTNSVATVLLTAAAELRMTKMDYRDRPRGWSGCSEITATFPFVETMRERLHTSGTPLSGDPLCGANIDGHTVRWTALFKVSDSMYLARFTYPVGLDAWETARCWVEHAGPRWRAGCG